MSVDPKVPEKGLALLSSRRAWEGDIGRPGSGKTREASTQKIAPQDGSEGRPQEDVGPWVSHCAVGGLWQAPLTPWTLVSPSLE